MGIIIKFIVNNIREKKFRTFLIVVSVTLSAALFFASLALSGTIEQTFMARIKREIGNSDLVIEANEQSPAWMFRLAKTMAVSEQLEYAVGLVQSSATYKTDRERVNLALQGYYLDDLAKVNPYALAKRQDLEPFTGHKIIFSTVTAQKYHFKIGATVELKINENRYRFKIVGIAQPTGLFQDDGRSNTAVVPRETLAQLFGTRDLVSKAFLKLKASQSVKSVITKLSEEYNRYTVRESLPRAELREHTQAVSTPLFIMLVLVLFISAFIIYSSFKVIIRERLPVIGTFRSIGATRKLTDLVLFAESCLYGMVGGALGCLLGLGILYVMAYLTRPDWLKKVAIVITYSPSHFLYALALAVILPVVSSCFPIVKASRIPIKEIIFDTMGQPKKKRWLRFYLGLSCLAMVFTAPWLAPQDLALAVDIVCMLLAVTAVVLLVPFLTFGFVKLFEALYESVLGNEGVLAAKNLRENQSVLNNIALLAIGISGLLMINTLSFSVLKEVANFYKDAQFDIWMWSYQANRKYAGIVRSIDGVSGVYGVYGAENLEIDGRKEKIALIHGIREPYFGYFNFPVGGERHQLLQKLDSGRNILLTRVMKEKLQIRKGDLLTLKLKRGKRVYQVVGFFNSLLWGGEVGLVSERFLKADMRLSEYQFMFIKTSQDPAAVVGRIKKKCARQYPWVETLATLNRQDNQRNRQMFVLLQGFSIMTLIIGVFGVFNNLMISFIERRRPLAMMRSVGMSKRQTLKMILIEALTGGMIGGGVGVLAGTLLIWLIPFLLKAIDQMVPIHYSLKEYGIAFLCGVIITVVASIGPALKSSRFKIIEAIKYE